MDVYYQARKISDFQDFEKYLKVQIVLYVILRIHSECGMITSILTKESPVNSKFLV
jgi:hypothetical protein